mmetsp:Transcript_16122/g.32461  ORF Transcript_16122/g.32461 Transcript_16122/m.32461 type:complete len:133 (-) Transcript_16122:2657-3055(-)
MASFGCAAYRRLALVVLFASHCSAFLPPASVSSGGFTRPTLVADADSSSTTMNGLVRPTRRPSSSTTGLRMGLDLVTYLRTEWISAALCTNQTPRSADVCLQLGTEDGRAGTCPRCYCFCRSLYCVVHLSAL